MTGPGVHHAPAARPGLPTGAIDDRIDFRPRNQNPVIGVPSPLLNIICAEIFELFQENAIKL